MAPPEPGPAFALSPPQERLVEETRRLAREALLPLAATGSPGRVNRALVRALGETGILPRIFPLSAGGASPSGACAMDLCLLREALAMECTEAETALALQGLGAYPIVQSGSAELVARYVSGVAQGALVAAFALSEPGAGSDAGSLELRADRDGADYRLSGTKTWISNAPGADVYTVFARTTQGAGSKGVSAFVVPGDTPGLAGEPLDLLAPHAVGRLVFDAVRVPADHLLGERDRGLRVALRTLDLFRPSVGAFAVGMAQAALDAALVHARSRTQFGQPLVEFQGVSHRLAEMATRTDAARLLVYRAASLQDAGCGSTREAAMAKLFATEAAQWVVDGALQVHGAAGLVRGHLLEHLYREVRATRIYEGTSEIQRSIITRELLREKPAQS